MLQHETADDFIVATGESYSVEQFVEEASRLLDVDWKKVVEVDERYFRPAEVDYLKGDASKARKMLGWKPRTGFHRLVEMMVESDLRLASGERMLRDAEHEAGLEQ
jgi:GDPmannose 4,6-dehydratase